MAEYDAGSRQPFRVPRVRREKLWTLGQTFIQIMSVGAILQPGSASQIGGCDAQYRIGGLQDRHDPATPNRSYAISIHAIELIFLPNDLRLGCAQQHSATAKPTIVPRRFRDQRESGRRPHEPCFSSRVRSGDRRRERQQVGVAVQWTSSSGKFVGRFYNSQRGPLGVTILKVTSPAA